MKTQFAVISGPDAYHWQHTTTIHDTYRDALVAYNAIGGTWSAVIIRMDYHDKWEPARVSVKRQNQYASGQASAWCDAQSYKHFPSTVKNCYPGMAGGL